LRPFRQLACSDVATSMHRKKPLPTGIGKGQCKPVTLGLRSCS
jgi:hypothetical protein